MILLALPWVGLVFVGLAAAPVADLILRPDRVKLWYGLPLLAPFPLLLLAPLMFGDLEWRSIENLSFILAWFHILLAGILLWLGMTLAAARGLRPEGLTRRRRRTSVTAITILVVLGALPILIGALQTYLGSMGSWAPLLFWAVFGSFAGVLWVLALNREGPYRLSQGKRWSAVLLLASLFQFCVATAHMVFVFITAYPEDWEFFSEGFWLTTSPVLLLLALGLRFLSGPLPRWPLLACAALGSTLLLPRSMLLLWRPVPASVELPVWVDLRGEPGSTLGVARHLQCVWVLGDEEPVCGYQQNFIAASPQTPLTALPDKPSLLVEDGRRTPRGEWAHGSQHLITEHNGLAKIDDEPQLYALGPPLHEALQKLGASVLHVRSTPAWTAQDFVSICASHRWNCELDATQ